MHLKGVIVNYTLSVTEAELIIMVHIICNFFSPDPMIKGYFKRGYVSVSCCF